jgi:NAD(P)-dependent dehydrogenase (short-subunit alcohol dehydrogenase family)
LAKEALPHMEKRGKASIIFISSVGGYAPNYAVNSKFSILNERHFKIAINFDCARWNSWGPMD